MQGGFTKHCCFLCQWVSRATAERYVRKDWPAGVTYIPGNANIKEICLIDPKNVLMPPFDTKLGLIKNFVKQLGKSSPMDLRSFATSFPI